MLCIPHIFVFEFCFVAVHHFSHRKRVGGTAQMPQRRAMCKHSIEAIRVGGAARPMAVSKHRSVVSGTTAFIPLVGHPVRQVRSPEAINTWFVDNGVDAVMVPMDIRPERVGDFFAVLRAAENCPGCSVTVPHKQSAFLACDEVNERARRAKAVNTIRRSQSGRLIGDMTDGIAMVAALEKRGFQVGGATVLLVGAGAAGTAIAFELAEKGASVLVVIDVDQMRQRALMNALSEFYPQLRIAPELEAGQKVDIAINASTVGMQSSDPMPFPVETLVGARIFADAVTKVTVTPWLEEAQRRGHAILTGQEMAVAQLPIQLGYLRFLDPKQPASKPVKASNIQGAEA
jgi:shikimate dehydrogenase